MNLPVLPSAALVALALLGIGFYGLLTSRHLIQVVISLQILVKSAVLGLVLAGGVSGEMPLAQSLAATVIVADTVVAVIGIALALQVGRRLGTLDVQALSRLRG